MTTQRDDYPRMTALALTFPTLARSARQGTKGIQPFNAQALDEWASVCSSGERHAVAFLLAVYHGRVGTYGPSKWVPKENKWGRRMLSHWRCAPFDIVDAMGTWDYDHRAACLAWLADPWYP